MGHSQIRQMLEDILEINNNEENKSSEKMVIDGCEARRSSSMAPVGDLDKVTLTKLANDLFRRLQDVEEQRREAQSLVSQQTKKIKNLENTLEDIVKKKDEHHALMTEFFGQEMSWSRRREEKMMEEKQREFERMEKELETLHDGMEKERQQEEKKYAGLMLAYLEQEGVSRMLNEKIERMRERKEKRRLTHLESMVRLLEEMNTTKAALDTTQAQVVQDRNANHKSVCNTTSQTNTVHCSDSLTQTALMDKKDMAVCTLPVVSKDSSTETMPVLSKDSSSGTIVIQSRDFGVGSHIASTKDQSTVTLHKSLNSQCTETVPISIQMNDDFSQTVKIHMAHIETQTFTLVKNFTEQDTQTGLPVQYTIETQTQSCIPIYRHLQTQTDAAKLCMSSTQTDYRCQRNQASQTDIMTPTPVSFHKRSSLKMGTGTTYFHHLQANVEFPSTIKFGRSISQPEFCSHYVITPNVIPPVYFEPILERTLSKRTDRPLIPVEVNVINSSIAKSAVASPKSTNPVKQTAEVQPFLVRNKPNTQQTRKQSITKSLKHYKVYRAEPTITPRTGFTSLSQDDSRSSITFTGSNKSTSCAEADKVVSDTCKNYHVGPGEGKLVNMNKHKIKMSGKVPRKLSKFLCWKRQVEKDD